MPQVFDTSSLMALVLERGGEGVEHLFDEHVLDLTVYEAGNVLWKAHTRQNRIDGETLERLVSFLDELQSEVEVRPVSTLDLDRTMTIAVKDGLTFYDAAYVACAEAVEGRLTTEDRELREAARGYVDVASVDDL